MFDGKFTVFLNFRELINLFILLKSQQENLKNKFFAFCFKKRQKKFF